MSSPRCAGCGSLIPDRGWCEACGWNKRVYGRDLAEEEKAVFEERLKRFLRNEKFMEKVIAGEGSNWPIDLSGEIEKLREVSW